MSRLPPATFQHHAMFYDSDEQFLSVALPFARKGLAAREPVFIATAPANSALLRRHMGRQADRVEFADADSWYHHPARTLLSFHDKARATSGRSRVLGEAVWHERTEDQAREWTRYEALLNLALAATGAWHLCPYNVRVLPAAVVNAAQLTHPHLASGTDCWANPAYLAPERFSAACDTALLPDPPRGCAQYRFGQPQHVARLRGFTASQARAAGLPAERIDHLLVAVDEAASNAVQHGAGWGTCRIWSTAAELLCEITDPHGTLDPALAGYLPPATGHVNGRGLWIVRQLCDAVDIRTGPRGTTVRLHMHLRPIATAQES